MKTKFSVKKNWRAVGACEFDVFHRDTKKEITEIDTVGEPVEVFAVVEGDKVIADCYTRADAHKVRDALEAITPRTQAKPWTFKSDSCGYMLYYKGAPVRGAGTRGTAKHTSDGRRRAWQHVRADIKMHAEAGRRECERLNREKAKP